MRFIPFPADWPRREAYAHYRHNPCSYSVTQTVDITALRHRQKQLGWPLAPALIYAICRTVNQLPALRMAEQGGQPGYWYSVCPAYTVFHPSSETFSVLWSEYSPDFSTFLQTYQADMAGFGQRPDFFPKGPAPAHAINISIAPWLDFSGFNLDYGRDYLLPVFTLGRLSESVGAAGLARVTLPLAVQANHAACDGFHIARFFAVLDEVLAEGLDTKD